MADEVPIVPITNNALIQREPSTSQGEPSSSTENINQDQSVGCSQTKEEQVQDSQRETPREVEDIPSNVDHHSCLHIWTRNHPPTK